MPRKGLSSTASNHVLDTRLYMQLTTRTSSSQRWRQPKLRLRTDPSVQSV